jgi:glycosyltransferase involved in cell wall biosynthesis
LENPLSESCFTIYYEFAVKFSDAIIAPTDELREFFGRRYHKVISAIPNCISYLPTDSYSTKPSTNSSAKIFFHANFDLARSLRELERLSEVVRRIQARGYMLRVLVAGPGSQRLGNVREPLIKLGYVRDPYLFLLDSDLQILPLKDLGMGLHSRIVEGMAAGKPIVASREACCGFLRYLDESGIVVCDSIDQMVQAVCSLLDDPIRRNEMGVRNRLLADRLFSPQSIGVSLERVYSELMNK